MFAVACALVIVACGSTSGTVDENRQFANEVATRTPDTALTVTPPPVLDVDATPVSDTSDAQASPESLLRSRGAPDTLYILSGGRLISLSIRAGTAVVQPISLPDDARILGFDGSPASDRVAVLFTAKDLAPSLAFFDRQGTMQGEPVAVLRDAVATPVSGTENPDQYFVNWSPQGTDVLVSDGVLLETVDLDGNVDLLSLDDYDGTLIAAVRSPQGNRIAVQFRYEDGSEAVFVKDIGTGKSRELRPLSTRPHEGLTNLQWLPNGGGLVYVHGALDRGVVMRGQLYQYRLGQERSDLLATSGRGGPSATITEAEVSPDGRSVAYVISLLDGSTWSFHSLWVRSLDGYLRYQIPAVPRGVVGHIAWVHDGIAWEQRRDTNAPGQVLVLGERGAPMVVFNQATSPIFATPSASPVASPGATPVASPVATPETPGH